MRSDVQATERYGRGFYDPRALLGSPIPAPMTVEQRRAEGWGWLDAQWELWPRPDLKRAMIAPPCIRFKPAQ